MRGVIAASISRSSMFSVSGRISTNTGVAPRSTTALAVETKVKDGRITSSPGPRSHSSAANSSAAVQEVVSRYAPRAEALLHQLLRTPGERAIAAGMTAGNGLADVDKLGADDARLVEWDVDLHAHLLRRAMTRGDAMSDHSAADPREPNGHQWSVIVGAGKRKPRSTYKLCTATLWDEMLVETSSTPSRSWKAALPSRRAARVPFQPSQGQVLPRTRTD